MPKPKPAGHGTFARIRSHLSFRTGALPTRHCEGVSCRDAGIACGRAESLGVDSLGPWVEGRGRVIDPRPPGAHVGCVLRLCGLTRGMVVRRTTRRPTRRSTDTE